MSTSFWSGRLQLRLLVFPRVIRSGMISESMNQMNAIDFLLFTWLAAAMGANVWLYNSFLKARGTKITATGTKVKPRRAMANTDTQPLLKPICSASTACMWAVLAWTSAFLLFRVVWSTDIVTPLPELSTEEVSERVVLWTGMCGAFALAYVAISPWPLYAACTRRRRIICRDVFAIAVAMSCGTYLIWQFLGHAIAFLFRPEARRLAVQF